MKTSFPRLIARAALLAVLVAPAALVSAQIPTGSSARAIPTEVEKADPGVLQVIARAEDHFKRGKLNLDDNRREQARDEFDKAVDVILESGMDVRASQRLQTYYLELVERIYRLEVPNQQLAQPLPSGALLAQSNVVPASTGAGSTGGAVKEQIAQIGFREQKFEPSPLDDLSKLVLTESETNVNPEDIAGLEQAKNSIDFGFNTNPLIQQFINYYQGRGRATMETGMRRSGQFMRMARKIFREEGVPEDVTWLGQVESAWRPRAQSWAAASGLWQFIPGTGQTYGLRQTAWVDERNSFEKATRASARYLKDLARHYNGNWELAMAAYNTGQGNVDRAIARAGRADFWAIYPYIAQETRNYVPNILATILIAKNPEKYGFRNIRPDSPLSYDIVRVPSATSLHHIAAATGISVDYIRSINPELRRDVTPRGEAYDVRIPGGKANQFVAYLKNVPVNQRDSAPRSNVQLTTLVRAKVGSDAPAGSSLMKIKARAGDTIAKIAERSNVSADDVARLNGMAVDAELQPGQEIKVPSSASFQGGRRRGGR
ncbi:MAG TPA: transglycosylase SLT domain-containing protein [Pyrinomonadaceae bacterium]|nr:transglycosylase SLT domain-containing protein [Pyrinomonadaceae bacterium]